MTDQITETGTTDSQDVTVILATDHREFLSLIAAIRVAPAATEKRDLTDTLIAELVRHAVAEEMYVYPAMKEHLPDGKEAVEHDTKEHKELEVTMKKMESADTEDAAYLDIVGELEEILRDHIDDEENEQFPKLRQHIPAADLLELGTKVEEAKKAAPTRPHPLAPNNALFHKLVGPGVGFVDRLRDHITHRNTGE